MNFINVVQELLEKQMHCWKGYKKKGTKKLSSGKVVNNCVKENINESKSKHSKQEAGYISKTKKPSQICENCTMWRSPNKCSAVSGNIEPEGWCKWWKKSHRKA
jgi:hypothetical protein